jgi:hypothetical protein
MTLEIWGTIGVLGLAAALVMGLLDRRGDPILRVDRGGIAWPVLAVALYLVAFLRLPDEPAYLIPVVPFVLLLLARVARPAAFAIACACIIVSPFLLDLGRPASGIAPGDLPLPPNRPIVVVRPRQGALLVDRRQRVTGMHNGEGIAEAIQETRGPAVVVVASWLPQLEVLTRGALPEGVRMAEYVRAGEADSLVHSGTRLYYVPGTEAGSSYYEHVDLAALGGVPLAYEPKP